MARRVSPRPVLVRAAPGGGGGLAVHAVARELGESAQPVAALPALEDDELLVLRRAHRDRQLVMASTDQPLPAGAQRLVDYLRPVVVDLAPATLADVAAIIEEVWQSECSDELAAAVLHHTEGRIDDVIDVAEFLSSTSSECRLVGLPATARRLPATAGPEPVHRWALAAHHRVRCLAAAAPPPDGARPVDAAVVVQSLTQSERVAALRFLCDRASELPPEQLTAAERVAIGAWWCELMQPGDPLGHHELVALFAGVSEAFMLNRWPEALRMADRLWVTTHVPMAGVALAAALCRSAPDDRLQALETHTDDKLRGVAAFTRASWQFFVEHDPAAARATLDAALGGGATEQGLLVDGHAMLDAYLGAPHQVDARLAERPATTEPVTPFALSVLVMADLVRGRHGRVINRLDDELGRLADPGMNLTAERYRFFRAATVGQAGFGQPDLHLDFTEMYERALRVGDDWTLGWTAWGAGLHAARHGSMRVALRRLTTSAAAFTRADRPGFAMWPASAMAQVHALVGAPADVQQLQHPSHAVVADLADAQLAVAMVLRAQGRPLAEVAAQLRLAARTARDQGELVSSYRIAHEQLAAGLDIDEPLVDDAADGMLVDTWAGAASTRPDAVEQAGLALVGGGWPVLGVRVLGRAMQSVRRADPRWATRLGQTIRTVQSGFSQPLAVWALPPVGMPTLSARELEIAEAVAAGAGRDELAESLVVSRRTIDSHLQRIYAKLGVSNRAELREWLGTR